MFTGLIADLGSVAGVRASGDGVVLTVTSPLSSDVTEGDSVAVNGVCLTAVDVDVTVGAFSAEVMNETLRLSSLAEVATGSAVNLELALRPTDRLGGHVVQGHVDGTGTIVSLRPDGFSRHVEIAAPESVLRYIVHKGSITVDGISLTVSDVTERSFTVSLIPETLERTNLGSAEVGAIVNLEVDVLAKYVERLIRR